MTNLLNVCGVLCSVFSMVQCLDTSLINSSNSKEPSVCIANGCMRGITMPGYQSEQFEAFLGIPYAMPPTGKLRFSNPVPVDNWTGIMDATKPKMECIQINYLIPDPKVTGSEDCLYLNVYRPQSDYESHRKSLPVMVFIHGGAFFAGSIKPDDLGPQYFMDTGDVILVMIAYRLGAFGFLSTGDASSTGNFGLKDQTLALQWIQDNIEQFGGDSNAVTIFGVSAGGASVHMHMLSPLSTGLFQRAIVMSGNAIANYNVPHRSPLTLARKQAGLVGIRNAKNISTKDLIRELRKIDADKIIESGLGLRFWSVDPLTVYRPVVEPNLPGAFLTRDPLDILQTGDYKAVPWMTGTVQNEGAVRAAAIVSNETVLNDFNSKFNWLLPRMVSFDTKSTIKNERVVERLKSFYLNQSDKITPENAQKFIDIMSDSAFLYPFYKSIQNYLNYADLEKGPLYLYRFAFKGPISYSAAFTQSLTDFGVVHLDDTIYLFRSWFFPEFPKDSTYAGVIQKLVQTYVEFAQTGRPKMWSALEPCTQNYTGDICDYQEFTNSIENPEKIEVRTNNKFNLKMIKLWDELGVL